MVELIFDKNEDWDKRTLCSDEACIGTIGADGKCRECGKAYDGDLSAAVDSSNNNMDKIEASYPPAMQAKEDTITDEEWDKRVLCSDGACIGVIGLDGKCTECGKPLEK